MKSSRDKPCPQCQAKPGDPCVNTQGEHTTIHPDRMLADFPRA